MTFWRKFNSINEDLAFISGFSLNILLLILIKRVKIKAMQKYNIILFQCCCVDILQVVTSFIVKPMTLVHEKSQYFFSNGFLRPIGGPIEMLGIILWATSICFCVASMPVSCVFRYRIVCWDPEISKKFYIISLLVAFFGSSTYGGILWKFHYWDNRNMTYLAEKHFAWLLADDEGKVKAVSVCFAVSFIFFNFN